MRLKTGRPSLDRLQPIGRALMLPIAVLPVAGLLLRLGQPDMLGIPFVAAAGDAIFAQIGLLFAIGVAVGLARENNGAAGLAGAVAFVVLTGGAKALFAVPPGIAPGLAADAWRDAAMAKLTVPAGLSCGLVSGWLYNRYATIRVPDYLAFFGGRRFVPIAAGGAGLAGALLVGIGLPMLEAAIDGLSRAIVGAGPFGLFVYGVLNRLLLVTGLHHILNNIAWFILGDFHGATGDLKRFFAGDPTAGGFMSGFFPIMMFGLPAACLAMYHEALPERRKAVAGMLLSLGLTSFLTGVTEPIEFSFMLLAPGLYALHAVLTGLSMVLMDLLGVRLGFGFSAGLADFALNYGLATRPLLLLPVGAFYAGLYYASFRFFIRRFDLKTPGRDDAVAAGTPAAAPAAAGERGHAFVTALGGADNLAEVDACTTRLRLVLADPGRIDEAALRGLGARGVLRLRANGLQVVLGPLADSIAQEIRIAARAPAAAVPADPAPEGPGPAEPIPAAAIADMIEALGGRDNILVEAVCANRLVVRLADPLRNRRDVRHPAIRGIAMSPGGLHHVVADPSLAWPADLAAHA